MTNPDNDLQKLIWSTFESVPLDDPSQPTKGFMERFAPELARTLTDWHQKEVKETEKAYGGCRNCFGKGYSTVIEYASGYDTDQDIGSPGGKVHYRKPDIRFCTCDRGKQLEKQVKTAVREAGSATNKHILERFQQEWDKSIESGDTTLHPYIRAHECLKRAITPPKPPKQEGINPQREGRNGQFKAHYWRYHNHYVEDCDTLEEAKDFLDSGEEYGELSTELIETPDGVIEGDELHPILGKRVPGCHAQAPQTKETT